MKTSGETQTNSGIALLDVLVIGAGFSGVCMGVKLLEAGITDFVILEKEKGIGGTWYKNSYPGAACDVPSHFYCFSFAPNPDWSRVYSPQPEIQAYIKKCADDFGVTPYIQFDSGVEQIDFHNQNQIWSVHLPDGRTYSARHLVIGSGGLNTPSIPEITGLENFEGPVFHTARWRHDVDLNNKNVVVIGSAASAIQAVPKLAEIVENVVMFQRTPNYIAPRRDRAYTQAEKDAFRRSSLRLKMLRWKLFWRFDLLLAPLFKRRSRMRPRATRFINDFMKTVIKDPELQQKLTPSYELGCKRILISDDFYPALTRDNVSVVTEGIKEISQKTVIDDAGIHHKADVIVMATGFNLKKQMASIDLIGRDGRSLRNLWADEVSAYHGVMVPGFPNAYFVTGPNTGVGSTSIVFMIESQISFIMRCLKEAGRNKLIEPTEEATLSHNQMIQKDLSQTVWATDCKSWYKDEAGRIETLYPHTARRFKKEKRRLNKADFRIALKMMN